MAASTPAKKKGKRPPSAARVAAIAAVDNAKSDQEKTLARTTLKLLAFKEVVTPRVRRVLKLMDNIEKMASSGSYKWDPADGAKIAKALSGAADRIALKLSGAKAQAEEFSI